MKQHQGRARPHRAAAHFYGAWDAASFWEIADAFDAWRRAKLPDAPVIITEFSGWPGIPVAQQKEVMTAGAQYLQRPDVEWVAWFSGYNFEFNGRPWGTHLAEVDASGGIQLTELGEHFLTLVEQYGVDRTS
jgi:hypothetical protein